MSLISPNLYIGSATEASSPEFLKRHRISAIVNCAKEIPNFFPGQYEYVRLDLDDEPHQNLSHVLNPIADFIIKCIKSNRPVLVHCAAGVSRSGSIIIYTLMKMNTWSFDTAFKFARKMHSKIEPNHGFVQQLIQSSRPIQPPIAIDYHPQETNLDEGEIPMPTRELHNRGWSSLTFDCEECDLPQYSGGGRGGGIYARIFS